MGTIRIRAAKVLRKFDFVVTMAKREARIRKYSDYTGTDAANSLRSGTADMRHFPLVMSSSRK